MENVVRQIWMNVVFAVLKLVNWVPDSQIQENVRVMQAVQFSHIIRKDVNLKMMI